MARLNRQGGYFVEYIQPLGSVRFQACNSNREEAMGAARATGYVARVWSADGCAIEREVIAADDHGEYYLDTIIFLINPELIYESINEDAFDIEV